MTIAIVFGGKSFEHDVSIVTAKQIYSVAKLKYDVKLLYLDRQNNLFEYTNAKFNFEDFKGKNNYFKRVIVSEGQLFLKNMFGYKPGEQIMSAIICCHGGSGENGELESYFVLNGIPVSAGSTFALGVAMDKWRTKQQLRALKINVIDGVLVDGKMSNDEIINLVEDKLDYPVIVKPNCGGSSIGIEVAKTREQLEKAVQVGFEFDESCVVENAIQNFDEYNQAILGDENNFKVSSIDKVEHKKDILTFKEKYLSGGKQNGKGMKSQSRTFECDLPQKIQDKINQTSRKIFKSLGFYGVIRIDYIYDKRNNKIYVNEINAVPGSLGVYFFKKLGGIGFIDRLVEISIQNFQKNQKFNKEYITNLF